jgi:hypothetical protein
MKKAIITALAALGLATGLSAQTNAIVSPPTKVDQILNLLGSATNWAVESYATYAQKSPTTKWGGGCLVVYNVTDYVGLGLGLDWLGQLSLVSANVTLQAPFHLSTILPGQLVTTLHLQDVQLSPFVLGGIGTAYSGGGNFNGGTSTIQDVGAYVEFGHFLGGRFNIGGCYGQWTGVGPYDVKREHIFAGMSWGF